MSPAKRRFRYRALVADYDGTLAKDGFASEETVVDLLRLREAGWNIVLATGRVLPELRGVFQRLDLFHSVVAENGALRLDPGNGRETLLAEPPPAEFARELRRRGVERLVEGRVVVATIRLFDAVVAEVIREMSLDLRIVYNNDAVMALPPEIDKGSGTLAALSNLGIPPVETVAVGDAENDERLLDACGFGVAVAGSVRSLLDRAAYVTAGKNGEGVRELIRLLLADELPGRPEGP